MAGRKNYLAPEKVQIIRANYARLGGRKTAQLAGASEQTVIKYAKITGVFVKAGLTPQRMSDMRRLFPDTDTRELADMFGVKPGTVRWWAYKMHLKKSAAWMKEVHRWNLFRAHRACERNGYQGQIESIQRRKGRPRLPLTDEQILGIKEDYPKMLTTVVAEKYGLTTTQMKSYAHYWNLKKDPEVALRNRQMIMIKNRDKKHRHE